jgi:hypothetical protein
MKKYFIAGPKLFAFNAKCCTSSFLREIIKTYHPQIEEMISSAAYPEGKTADNSQHHRWVPARVNPDRPVVQLVRDPVERFRSAMAQAGLKNVGATLQELASEEGDYGTFAGRTLAANVHFLPQTRFTGDIAYFRAPDQVEEAASALGIAVPAMTNESEPGTKPYLSDAEIEQVKAWYADDVALWLSIGGQ